jgi:hypothetical protein
MMKRLLLGILLGIVLTVALYDLVMECVPEEGED